MIAFREYIQQKLQPFMKVYFQEATSKDEDTGKAPKPPYITYTYNANESELRQDITLELNLWDASESSLANETLAESIDAALNRHTENTPTMQIYIVHNSPWQLPIPDPQKNIQRLQLRYICKTYFK